MIKRIISTCSDTIYTLIQCIVWSLSKRGVSMYSKFNIVFYISIKHLLVSNVSTFCSCIGFFNTSRSFLHVFTINKAHLVITKLRTSGLMCCCTASLPLENHLLMSLSKRQPIHCCNTKDAIMLGLYCPNAIQHITESIRRDKEIRGRHLNVLSNSL